MLNSIMVVDEENEVIKNTTSLNARPRTKKKSTLTKLKERQHKDLGSTISFKKEELGSTAFLEKDNRINTTETTQNVTNGSKEDAVLHSAGDSLGVDQEAYSLSTRGSSEEPLRRPRPRPRGRRQSSDIAPEYIQKYNSIASPTDNKDSNDRKQDNSDGSTIQMFKNLKMDNDEMNSAESSISHSNFVPKPPSTPRKPRSNPRTPRGFVVVGKGEKRIREPWSSGDEVEENKETSNRINDIIMSSNTMDIVNVLDTNSATDLLSVIDDVTVGGEKSPPYSGGILGQSIHTERLKNNTRHVGSENGSQVDLQKLGKPPGHRNLTHIDTQNSNYVTASNASSSKVGEYSELEFSQDKSTIPSRSKNPDGHLSQMPVSYVSESSKFLEKGSPVFGLYEELLSTNDNNDALSKHNMIDNTSLVLGEHTLTDANAVSQSIKRLHTSESPLKEQVVSSPPRTARLDPISPKSHPPPLPEELSSRSLRTMYKIDPDVYPRTGVTNLGAGADSGTNSNADNLSQRSFTSASVLPIITTKEARSRNGCEGSMLVGSPSSSLGTDELDRYFPERKVNVFVGTWNMNELKDMTLSVDDFILPEKCDYVQDVYAIGTQENNMNKKEWEVKIQETLGLSHVMFHSVSLGSLHLAVYVRRDLIWFCSVPEDDVISLRSVTMVKTKGAIGICFNLFGTSFLFINCHLTSDRNNETSRKKNRLEDYCKVISEMKLPKMAENSSTSKKSTDVTTVFDCIFWFGDLNFRIERKRHAVERKVNQIAAEEFPNFETLLGGDQLLNYMAEGKIFGGFQEGRINFHPTFKFDLDTNTYDTSAKNRVPSYTDRIMFRSKKKRDMTCIQYDSVMSIKNSDHRAVFGLYEAAVKPGKDNMVYSVGHFDRAVYTEAIRRRKAALPARKKQSAVCAIQ